MAAVIGAGIGAYELALLAAGALGAMFLASPQGQQAVKNTAQAISDLAQPAEKSDAPAVPKAQTDCEAKTGDPDNKCKDIYDQIDKIVKDFEERKEELLIDKKDLYHRAYDKPNLGRRVGSYRGHIIQANQRINTLRNLIDKAEAMGCPVPNEVKNLLNPNSVPQKPRSAQ